MSTTTQRNEHNMIYKSHMNYRTYIRAMLNACVVARRIYNETRDVEMKRHALRALTQCQRELLNARYDV